MLDQKAKNSEFSAYAATQHEHTYINCFLKKVTKRLLRFYRGITESVSSCQVMNKKKMFTFWKVNNVHCIAHTWRVTIDFLKSELLLFMRNKNNVCVSVYAHKELKNRKGRKESMLTVMRTNCIQKALKNGRSWNDWGMCIVNKFPKCFPSMRTGLKAISFHFLYT